jgi:hypothetical protein
MNREAMTVIAELMWALRRSGSHTFFPGMPLHKAQPTRSTLRTLSARSSLVAAERKHNGVRTALVMRSPHPGETS